MVFGVKSTAMQSITRYIFSQLLAAALFITLALTMVFFLVGSLGWIGYIVDRGLPAATFFYFTALLLPAIGAMVVLLRAPRRARRGPLLAQAVAS